MKKFIIMLMLVLFAFVPCVYSEESKCLDLLQPYVVEPVQADFTKFYWLSFSSPCRALQFFETLNAYRLDFSNFDRSKYNQYWPFEMFCFNVSNH